MMIFQEIVYSLGSLSIEDRDRLFELIRQQRMEKREDEILANAKEVCKDSGLKSLSAIDSRYAFGAILLNILQIIFSITEPQTL